MSVYLYQSLYNKRAPIKNAMMKTIYICRNGKTKINLLWIVIIIWCVKWHQKQNKGVMMMIFLKTIHEIINTDDARPMSWWAYKNISVWFGYFFLWSQARHPKSSTNTLLKFIFRDFLINWNLIHFSFNCDNC